MKKTDLINRTKQFAHRCVKRSAAALPNTYLGNHIKGQLIRSSTSVAANYRAVCLSQSKASFISKISIVIEECDETEFWLEFTIDEQLLLTDEVRQIKNELRAGINFYCIQKNSKKKFVKEKLRIDYFRVMNSLTGSFEH